jgi:hypothetical protein
MNRYTLFYFLFYFFLTTHNLYAQTIQRYGFASAASSSPAMFQFQSSIGELVVSSEFSSSNTITQGFVQNDFLLITTAGAGNTIFFKTYPNPTTGNVSVVFTSVLTSNVEIRVFDVSGKLLKIETVQSNLSELTKVDLDFSSLEFGLYFLEVSSSDKRMSQTVRIIKI